MRYLVFNPDNVGGGVLGVKKSKQVIFVIFDPFDGPMHFDSLAAANRDSRQVAKEHQCDVEDLIESSTTVYEYHLVKKHPWKKK